VVSDDPVLDGEHWTMPAPVTLSMTDSEIREDAAPMMASTVSVWMSRSTVSLAMSSLVPESPMTSSTSEPLMPPASLICSTASSTALIIAGPRTARSPVCGRAVPILRVPSTEAPVAPSPSSSVSSSVSSPSVSSGASVSVSVSPASGSSPPPQAVVTSASARPAAVRRSHFDRCMCFPFWRWVVVRLVGHPRVPTGAVGVLPVCCSLRRR
jgi:hypothetical protein